MTDHDKPGDYLPREPIDRLVGPIQRFLHVEAASGVVLLLCTIAALILANSRFVDGYLAIWKTEAGFRIGSFEMFYSLKHWINDGLMAIFFFVIGLEVKRELVLGELRDFRRAALPIAGALGGMIVPAAIYLALQAGEEGARGWAIPMATDIAFVVGCMAILGRRIPPMLRVFLLSLAIVDDIGAILVIAVGYTEGLSVGALLLGFVGIAVIFVLQRLGVRSFSVYSVVGVLVWLAFHESGVHATIAGVILGLMTPARSYVNQNVMARLLRRADEAIHGDWNALPHRADKLRSFQRAARETVSPLEYLETGLHPWVGFVIMPVFALANAGVSFEPADFGSPIAVAVIAGLVVGKPVGIIAFSWVAVRLGLKSLPQGLRWSMLCGGACLAGIGFTMAMFISELALDGGALDAAKVGVLGASAISALLGMTILIAFSSKQSPDAKPGA
jgi:NhaA family Na+:H+ antiporter